MNWISTAFAIGVIAMAGYGVERFWRLRRQRLLPRMPDAEFGKQCPSSVDPIRWLASRNELARFLKLEAECLLPEMRLKTLNTHFQLLGLPGIDIDGVYDIKLAHVARQRLEQVQTVGDVVELLAEQASLEVASR